MKPRKVRTLFLSDIHLGFRGCQAELLLDLLKSIDSDYIILVGDIIDLLSMNSKLYWPTEHNDVVRYIIKRTKKGTRVIYIPGNHDDLLREYCGSEFAGVEIHEEYTHTLADGRTLHCVHGDKFDLVIQNSKWLAVFGSKLYDISLALSRHLNALRKKLGLPYWSLSQYLKYRVKRALQYIDNFSAAVVKEAQLKGVDGIVAGHIHHPEITMIEGVLYANCGDFVESCSGIVENKDGSLDLIKW